MLIISTLDHLQELAGTGAIATSAWIPLTQQMIATYADLSGDRQWIHTDPERAAEKGPWGTAVAHGFLTLGLLSRMVSEALDLRLGQTAIVNYGLNRVRFPAPVRAGARIRGHFALLSCGPKPAGIEVVWQVTVEGEGESKPVCAAEWVVVLLTGAQI